MIKDCWHTARWQDKLKVWVSRTGWRPADVAELFPREKNDLAGFEKYDPPLAKGLFWYVLFQLIAVIIALNAVAATDFSYTAGLLHFGLLLATAVTTAFWLEGNNVKATLQWEALRLASLAVILLLGWQAEFNTATLVVLAIYGAINLAVLPIVRNAVGTSLDAIPVSQ